MLNPVFLPTLVYLLVIALAGRLVLSFLPAGAPGSHVPRDLPATWAASHTLGLLGMLLVMTLLDRAGLSSGWTSATLALILGAVLALRMATLPASLVPRHAPPAEPPRWPVRTLQAVLAAGLVLPWVRSSVELAPTFGNAVYLAAIVALIAFGLERARRAPLGRVLVLLALVAAPIVQELARSPDHDLLPVLLFAGGCAGTIPWMRRADRRGAAFAALCFASLFLWRWDGAPLALGGLAGLLLFTPDPGRARVAPWCLVGIGLALVLLFAGARPDMQPSMVWQAAVDTPGTLAGVLAALGRAAIDVTTWHVAWPVAGVGLALAVARSVREPEAPAPGAIDPPARELAALVFVLALALVGQTLVAIWRAGIQPLPPTGDRALLLLSPCAALLCGLVFVPAERP